jgi:hypothetical protein
MKIGERVKLVLGNCTDEPARLWTAGLVAVGTLGTLKKKGTMFHIVWDNVISCHKDFVFSIPTHYLPNYLAYVEGVSEAKDVGSGS